MACEYDLVHSPEMDQDTRTISHRPTDRASKRFPPSQAVRFAPLQGGVGRGTSCHTRAPSGGQQRSMEVVFDHSWPQAKACSRASLGGFLSSRPNTGASGGDGPRTGPG